MYQTVFFFFLKSGLDSRFYVSQNFGPVVYINLFLSVHLSVLSKVGRPREVSQVKGVKPLTAPP